MNKICKQCGGEFEVTNEDLEFLLSVSPVFDGKRYDIPAPTFCPDCRQQRRLAQCNEFNLYQGKCDLCGKKGLTEHSPSYSQPQYCKECWHSDKWDPRAKGRDFDFGRPFFEQYYELMRSVPALMLIIDGENVNCDYMHYAGSSKNSYLIFHADFCDNCMYGYGFKKDVSCVDGFYNLHCELCYDCIDVSNCYGLKACQDCVNCNSSSFLSDCIGCSDCFLCVGLRNKRYCFENKQLTQEEYEKKIAMCDLGSYKNYQWCASRLKELEKDHHFKCFHTVNTENCFGDYLKNCKDAKFCFDCEDVEGAKYCYQLVLGGKNVYDLYQYGTNIQQSYECAIVGAHSYHFLFVAQGHMTGSDLIYCWNMENCKNCFGCANMHHKSYCIFNQQYTKEEYEKLVHQIIEHMRNGGEWGEFFPANNSLYGYNKTMAQVWYPMKKEEILAKGWKWDDYEVPTVSGVKTVLASALPDNIKDVGDDILEVVIECEISKKLFKIASNELRFYRTQKLPLPRRAFYQRHMDRFDKRNPRAFSKRNCDNCRKEISTTYTPESGKSVYCEECYAKMIV